MKKGNFFIPIWIISMGVLFFSGCSVTPKTQNDFLTPQLITASFYGGNDGFDGRKTACGEIFDSRDLTAAHKTLPFGTLLRLENPKNGRAILVRITDRGPYISGREIDLSKQAAWELGMINDGVTDLIAQLRVEEP